VNRGDFEFNLVSDGFSRTLEGALGEIDFLMATFADTFLIELIGENFHFFTALRAATFERRQRLKFFPSRASFRRVHFCLLSWWDLVSTFFYYFFPSGSR
jgi:hypothetical protein